MPVQLVIKAPNQRVDDHTIECELDWTVLRLKNHLSEVYPTNPKPEEQRLIYAGRLIKDHLTVRDFITYEEGQKYTLHLVCSQHASSSPVHRSHLPPSDLNTPGPSSQPAQSSVLRQRVPQSDDSSSGNGSQPTSPHNQAFPPHPGGVAAGGLSPELVAQQMAAMQHFYAQYMAQFMQQAQFVGIPTAYPDLSSMMGQMNPQTGPPVVVPAENVVPANANRGQGNQNLRMNAQGGPLLDDEEDDAENRDWLDWFYILCRALVLFSILFFYSSLGRFMVVTGVAILIYMYQGGWFGGRQPQAPQQQQQQGAAAMVAGDAAEGNEEEEARQQAAAVNREPVSSPDVQRENEEQEEIQNMMEMMDGERNPQGNGSEPNIIQTFWIFLTSFFVSLIPEQPPPVNIN